MLNTWAFTARLTHGICTGGVHASSKPARANEPTRNWPNHQLSLHILREREHTARWSTCEHHQDMLRCKARGWHAWLRYQQSAARAKRGPSRTSPMIAVHGLGTPAQTRKGRLTQFFNGSIFSHGCFDGDRDSPSCGPECISGACGMRR